jgi:hypothetical protein
VVLRVTTLLIEPIPEDTSGRIVTAYLYAFAPPLFLTVHMSVNLPKGPGLCSTELPVIDGERGPTDLSLWRQSYGAC